MAKLSKKEKEKYTDAWRKQNSLLSPATIQFDVKKEEEKSSDVLSSALKRAVQENAVQRQAEAKKAVAKAIQDYTPQKVSNVNVAKHSGASLVNDLSSALKQAGQAILEGSFSDLDTYNAARTGNDRWLQMDTSKTDALAEKLAQQRMMTAKQAAQQQALIDARYKAQNFSTAQRFASDAGRAIGQVAPALIPGVGTPYLLGLGFGAGTNQAINDGATLEQASDYGALSAAKEVAIEKAFGGLKGMKALINPAKVTDKIANPVLRTGADLALRSAGEGMEEVVATAVDPTLQRMTYNPDTQDASRDEMLYSALLGAIASGGINIGVTGLNKVADFRKNSQTNNGNQKKTVQNQGVSPQNAQNGAGQAQDISASKYLPTPEKPAQNQFMEAEKIRKQMLAEQKQLLSQKRALEQKKAQMEQAERDNLYREIKNLEENIALLRGTQSSAFDDALFNAMDGYTAPEQKQETVSHDMPMSERTLDNVTNPKVKAYQSTHPEVKTFFREQAEIMLNDLNNMIDGGREYGIDPETRNVNTVRSQTRATSSQIERLLNAGMTKAQIRDGLERIIRDNGAENTANAKKVETTLDDALANGYQSMQGQIPKNLDYVYGNADIKKMRNAYNQLNSEESFANSTDPAGLINELEYLNQNITERQQLIDAYSELLPDMSVYETMTAEELHDEMDKLENASQYAPNEIAGEMMARHRYLELLEEGRVNEFIENEGLKTHVENMEKQLADKKLGLELPRASDEMKNIQKKLKEIEAKQAGISIFNKAATSETETVPEGYEMLPRPTVANNTTVTEDSSEADSEPDYEDFDVSQLPKEVYDFYDNIGQVGEKAGFNVRVVTGIENDANGRFDGQGNILIDGNKMTDTETINRVVAHEVFHFLKDTDEHKYIIDLAVKNAGVAKDQLIQNKIEDYYNRSKGKVVLDRDGALDEIGAAFMEDVLADPKMAERIWNQNPTLAQRIMRWFEDMVSKFRNTSAKNPNAEIYRKALDAYSRGLRNMQQQNRSQGEGRYALVGKNADEIEVYETSEDIKKLPYSERKKEFLRLMQEEYAGRTARFTVNGENYYARFAEEDLTKNVYGDKRSSPKGWKAKINVGADGGIFDLVENAKYKTSGDEKGKTTKAHKDVKDWDYFVKTVQIDNHVFDLLVNVRKKPDGEFVYSLQLNENKTKKASLPVANPEGNGVRMGAQRSRDIIPENEQEINTGTRYSLPKKMPNQKYIDQSDENLRNFMEGSAVVNEDGSPKVVYSGHGNTNLFGTSFDKKKATAGGFYFTANPEIASNYAKDKLGVKEYYENGDEYRIKNEKGQYKLKLRDIRLTDEQVEKFDEWFDEDLGWTYEDFVKERGSYDSRYRNLRYSGGKHSLSNVYWLMNELGYTETYTYHRKNGEEYRASAFEILMDEMGIEWDSYNQKSGGVFPIYLSIKNPIDTSQPFPQDVMKRLERIASRERRMSWEELDDAHWTANYPVYKWIEDIKRMEETGEETYWATQVPTKARKILQEMGYDGIKDTGGKMGGEEHEVWIAFEPTQVKSAIGNRGTYDATKKDMRYSLDDMVDEYGAIPKGEDPFGDNRDIDIPQQTADDNRVSRFARTAAESRNVHDRTVDMVISDMEQGRFIYEPSGNQEQISRADGLINHTGWEKQLEQFQNKYRSGERMTANDIVLGERLIQEAQRAGDYETAVDLIADIAAIGTELGQAVQALSVLKRLTPEGKVKALKRVEERINAGLVEQGKEPVKLPEGMAEQMLQAESQQMQSEIWDECIQEYANQVDATLADKINAWRYLAMLSNPKTHIRNMVGNGVMRGVSAVKRGIQTGLENRLLTAGEERYAELNRNVPQEYFDFAEWSWENDGKYRAQTGGGRYNDAIGQIEQNKRVFETDALEKARKANTELLEKEDMWFKKKTYVDTLARYMHTNGLSPSALQNTASHANYERGMKFALQEAYKGTFQEASTVANLIARLEHPNTNNKLVAAGAKMLVGGVLPFKKTPINILKRGVEYSPVGLMNGLYKMRRDVQEGNCTKAEAIDNIAAGLTGTGIMILGAFMAHMGWITAGAGEDDERKQWYEQQMGSQNYALVLPNGGTATIDWLAPSVMPLMAGAELYSQLTSENPANENSNAFISLLEAISKVANPALEMSMLQGVTDALQSYNSGTTGVLSDLITSTATSYGGQFIPAPVGAAARTVDDTIRSSYAPKDSKIGKTGEKFVRQQVNKLPVASKMNEPSIDVWGNERKREGGNIVGRAFNNFINPSTYSSNKKTELDEELESLYSATGESSVLPKAADSSFKYQDKTYYMSSKEKTVYDQTKGQKSRQYVSGFVKSSFYRNLSDSQKADIVSELYKLANYQAKKEMLKERGVPYMDDQYEKVLQSKVKPGDYYAMTEAMGDITGDGKKARRISYLEKQKDAGRINNEQYWYLRMTKAGTPSKADIAACPYDWIKQL